MLSALLNSEDGLKRAKQKIAETGNIVKDNLKRATQACNEYLGSVRALCI